MVSVLPAAASAPPREPIKLAIRPTALRANVCRRVGENVRVAIIVLLADQNLGARRLHALLHVLLPKATAISVLVHPANPSTATMSSELQKAARSMGASDSPY